MTAHGGQRIRVHRGPERLERLYRVASKHALYQPLHPLVREGLGLRVPEVPGRREPERLACIAAAVPLAGARVLDIGANTGFFTFGAVAAGAAGVHAFEGNRAHAAFLAVAAARLGLRERVRVTPRYLEFGDDAPRGSDVILCLNVLHHLGDDFGDRAASMETARDRMAVALRALAPCGTRLVLQMGFNWKGDRALPLFDGGAKDAQRAWLAAACGDAWTLEAAFAVPADGGAYAPLDESTRGRFDALGEFANRPLFVLRSRAADAGPDDGAGAEARP